MTKPTGSSSENDQPQSKPDTKPVEKIKSDEEKLPEKFKAETEKPYKEIEKVKSDWEKIPIKEHKPEKYEKIEKEKEIKEHKLEIKEHKPDKEKVEVKEHKPEKFELEKASKIELEKSVAALEKGVREEVTDLESRRQPPIDRDALLRHAEALEKMGRDLRHFIEQADRPDLTRGALQDEPDQQGSDGNA